MCACKYLSNLLFNVKVHWGEQARYSISTFMHVLNMPNMLSVHVTLHTFSQKSFKHNKTYLSPVNSAYRKMFLIYEN